MKKVFNFILTCIATLCIIYSCVDLGENQYQYNRMNKDGEYAILFDNNSYHMTKATVNTVAGNHYDSFKLFVWNSNNEIVMNPYLVNAVGTDSYSYENISDQELKYFSKLADNYSFIGIIPTNHEMSFDNGITTIKDIASFNVDDNRVSNNIVTDSQEEFLWSYKNVLKADYGNTVELPFNHANALIWLGFSSDRSDTELIDYVPASPEIPAHNDTIGVYFNIKKTSNLVLTASNYSSTNSIPQALIDEIKSYYSIDGGAAGDFDIKSMDNGIHTLKVVKDIPATYKRNFAMGAEEKTFEFFDGFKYLADNGYSVSTNKPEVTNYILIEGYVNGNAYTIAGLNYGASSGTPNSKPQYEIVETPAQPAVEGIDGIRLFTADSTSTVFCTHIPHTILTDATVSSTGVEYSNRTTSDDVITFSLPSSTTLNENPIWSPTTFYTIPGDTNLNYIVVKLSYTYNGTTVYDVRVPIKLPTGGLKAGKYYKYELYITSVGNGTNDPEEAKTEKNEIVIEGNPIIMVKLIDTGYSEGDSKKLTI